jgi:hypothetical protein
MICLHRLMAYQTIGNQLTGDPTSTVALGECLLCAKNIQRAEQAETVCGHPLSSIPGDGGPLLSVSSRGDHPEAMAATIGRRRSPLHVVESG